MYEQYREIHGSYESTHPTRREVKRELTWTDGYGTARTAKQMTSEHLWNVLGYLRDKVRAADGHSPSPSRMASVAPFYYEAIRELKRRNWL